MLLAGVAWSFSDETGIMLYTSGFVDDVLFPMIGPMRCDVGNLFILYKYK